MGAESILYDDDARFRDVNACKEKAPRTWPRLLCFLPCGGRVGDPHCLCMQNMYQQDTHVKIEKPNVFAGNKKSPSQRPPGPGQNGLSRPIAPAQQGECGRRRHTHRKKRHIKQYQFYSRLTDLLRGGYPCVSRWDSGQGPCEGE